MYMYVLRTRCNHGISRRARLQVLEENTQERSRDNVSAGVSPDHGRAARSKTNTFHRLTVRSGLRGEIKVGCRVGGFQHPTHPYPSVGFLALKRCDPKISDFLPCAGGKTYAPTPYEALCAGGRQLAGRRQPIPCRALSFGRRVVSATYQQHQARGSFSIPWSFTLRRIQSQANHLRAPLLRVYRPTSPPRKRPTCGPRSGNKQTLWDLSLCLLPSIFATGIASKRYGCDPCDEPVLFVWRTSHLFMRNR